MISERRFTDLTQYQRRLDAEIDAKVRFLYFDMFVLIAVAFVGLFVSMSATTALPTLI